MALTSKKQPAEHIGPFQHQKETHEMSLASMQVKKKDPIFTSFSRVSVGSLSAQHASKRLQPQDEKIMCSMIDQFPPCVCFFPSYYLPCGALQCVYDEQSIIASSLSPGSDYSNIESVLAIHGPRIVLEKEGNSRWFDSYPSSKTTWTQHISLPSALSAPFSTCSWIDSLSPFRFAYLFSSSSLLPPSCFAQDVNPFSMAMDTSLFGTFECNLSSSSTAKTGLGVPSSTSDTGSRSPYGVRKESVDKKMKGKISRGFKPKLRAHSSMTFFHRNEKGFK
eukprot:gnl/Carplike_NY0171/5447_a7452_188.p1 GENE.gnl/Carplike_NY0171/5447_a7452_188~~gnl/Carplike_NY0171/5447_a7452_188.p1  ORF type:complete len:278 (+),score=65.63 gnl/Carplike_NY0171/5447_a7452_188:954-1787(+)